MGRRHMTTKARTGSGGRYASSAALRRTASGVSHLTSLTLPGVHPHLPPLHLLTSSTPRCPPSHDRRRPTRLFLPPSLPLCRVQAAVGGLLSALVPRAKLVPAVRPEDMSQDPAVVAAYVNDPLNTQGNVRARTGNEMLRGFAEVRRWAGVRVGCGVQGAEQAGRAARVGLAKGGRM